MKFWEILGMQGLTLVKFCVTIIECIGHMFVKPLQGDIENE